MQATQILEYILATFDGIDMLSTAGCDFVYYDPARDIPSDQRQPFAKIVKDERCMVPPMARPTSLLGAFFS